MQTFFNENIIIEFLQKQLNYNNIELTDKKIHTLSKNISGNTFLSVLSQYNCFNSTFKTLKQNFMTHLCVVLWYTLFLNVIKSS